MASSSLTTSCTPLTRSSCPNILTSRFKSISTFSYSPFYPCSNSNRSLAIKAQTLDFPGSFFEGDDGPTYPPGLTAVEEKDEPQCPPGLRQYETMVVLRPDMNEDERLAFTHKYEELLVAGGGMYIEVFNRGVIPLAYSIRRKNKAGETNTYLDGIYLLFTYFTKPDSINILEETLKADDNVIRSMTTKFRKRKY